MGEIKAGSLDRRIIIYEKVVEKDDAGQVRERYREFYKCFAGVTSAATTSKETFEGDILTAISMKFFTIRYLPGVNETMLIKYENDFYNIHAVVEIGRKEGQKILAKKQEQKQHIEFV